MEAGSVWQSDPRAALSPYSAALKEKVIASFEETELSELG